MKSIFPFLRTTLIGGLLFMVPIIVLVAVFGKALAITHKLMDPLAENIPVESIVGMQTPLLLAIIVIVLLLITYVPVIPMSLVRFFYG